jgi:hypothetical protein
VWQPAPPAPVDPMPPVTNGPIDDNANVTTIASLMGGVQQPDSNFVITPEFVRFEVKGQTFVMTPDGDVVLERPGTEEGTFESISLNEFIPFTEQLVDSNWGLIFGLDQGG